MAGKVVVSTLNNDTGVLATQNGMTGIAKAWVNFDGTGTPAIRSSFNVSSITDNGTGSYTINFTTAMPNANYSATFLGGDSANIASVPLGYMRVSTTSSMGIDLYSNATNLLFDAPLICVSIFSS